LTGTKYGCGIGLCGVLHGAHRRAGGALYVHEYMIGGGFGGKQDYDEILAAPYCVREVVRSS
jgi:hypothetical protein